MSRKHVLDESQALLDEGKSSEAGDLLQEALAGDPQNPLLLLYSGLAIVEAGDTEEGLSRIQRALDADGRNPLLRAFYARALYDVEQYDEAVEQCEQVLTVQPEHPGAELIRQLCRAHRDPAAGLAALALSDLPDNAHLQGRALLFAEQVLKEAETPRRVDLLPDDGRPWELPGDTPAPAASDAQRSRWLKRSFALQLDGFLDRATAYAEAAMRSRVEDEVRVHLAHLYLEAGRYAEMERTLRLSFQEDPERNIFVGIALFEMGQFPEAIAVLNRAETVPQQPGITPPDAEWGRAFHSLGRAHLALDQAPEARRAFIRAARRDESIPANRLARAYLSCRGLADSPVEPDRAGSDVDPGLADSPVDPGRADPRVNSEQADSPINSGP